MGDRDRERGDRHRDRPKGPPPAAILDRLQKLRYAASQGKWDVYAWADVVEDLRGQPISADVRASYEEILAVMPSAAFVWSRYVAAEMGPGGSMEQAKIIFGRCLLSCPTVELHRQYLQFIKKSNEGRGAAGLSELRQAYEFSVDTVGQDMDAGGLWREYIEFLKSPRAGTEPFNTLFPGALEGQEEAARTPVVRRAYQRAVLVPMSQLEALWRDYEGWENKVDKQLARKVLDEWRPRFQGARGVLRDRRRRLDAVDPLVLPFPPGQGGPRQGAWVAAWNAFIAYEKSNPQRLEPGSPLLAQRVDLAYAQCLMALSHFPEVWHAHVLWAMEGGGVGKAQTVLARAQVALPGCALFHFVHADLLEGAGRAEAAQQVYEVLAQQLEAEVPHGTKDESGADAAPPPLSALGAEQGALVWVQYMRFLRRTAGAPHARQLFLRARKWQQTSPATAAGSNTPGTNSKTKCSGWQIYAAAARMEWDADRTSAVVPKKIFELGMEDARLVKDHEFIIAYHTFLADAGDTDNARAVCERGLSEPENAGCERLWLAYAAFEYRLGELAAAAEVERRMQAALAAASTPQTVATPPSLHLALLKYSFGGALPCTDRQRQHLQRAAGMPVVLSPEEEAEISERGAQQGRERERDGRFGGDGPPLPMPRDRDGPPPPRDRDWERDRERERDFRGGPPPGPRDEPGPRPMPDLLEQLAMDLPPPMALEGPAVPVDAVMDVVMFSDLSPAAVAFGCAELDAGRMPPSANGVEVPQVLEVAARGGRPFDGFDQPGPPVGDYGPLPGGPPGPHRRDLPPPHDPYWSEPDPWRGPEGPPGPRKRRWEGDRDVYGPPGEPNWGPPPDGRGPPPHWGYDDRRPPPGR